MLRDYLISLIETLKSKNKSLFRFIKSAYIYSKYIQQSFFSIFRIVRIDNCYLEFTNVCNLNCKFCSMDKSRAKGFLKEALLIKILEDIKKNNLSIQELSLHFAGETLLHPKLLNLLEIISKYKREFKRRKRKFPIVTLLTNAVTLKKELSKKILETNAIDVMRFSIDGGNKEKFESIRRGAKWDIVIKNANDFLSLNKSLGKKIDTRIITIVSNRTETKDFSKDFLDLKSRVTECFIREPHNWIGDIDLGIKGGQMRTGLCHFILKDFSIFWDGRVTTCCADLNGKGYLGNLNNQTIKEVFFGEPRKKIIKLMLKNKRKSIKVCQNCNL